jgi:predicted DCC family thiol-disulfide oxidoreductase YuxK
MASTMTTRAAGAEQAAEDAAVVLYDGVCGFCNSSVQFIIRNDRRGRFRFAALQSDVGKALLREHNLPAEEVESVVLIEDGKAYRKTRAALRIARRLDGAWKAFWPLVVVPAPLADVFYDLFARYRYRLFGKFDACPIPSPEVRARFLS